MHIYGRVLSYLPVPKQFILILKQSWKVIYISILKRIQWEAIIKDFFALSFKQKEINLDCRRTRTKIRGKCDTIKKNQLFAILVYY